MKLRSITFKFIAIISILMALVMALQFYLITETQKDVLSELNRISQSINTTTDRIFFKNFKEPPAPKVSASVKPNIKELPVPSLSSADQYIISDNKSNWVASFSPDKKELGWRVDSLVAGKLKGNLIWKHKNDTQNIVGIGSDFTFSSSYHDSANQKIEVVEIDINDNRVISKRKSGSVIAVGKASQPKKDVVSFVFPNLSAPKVPQVLRYNYNTSDFADALNDMRDRSLLITLALFSVSLVVISMIAGKFLKPIKSLNQSFDKVVRGDLDVKVEHTSSDEIGELSASFNHMVNELRKNKDKEDLMRRQERLASLGQLAAGVAHEIKNPLNAINLTIEHLNDKFVKDTNSQEGLYIATIQSEIRRLDKTVNNFLSYLRSEKLDKQPADVNALLEDICMLYEREIQDAGIELIREYADECIFELDSERFKTVLMNVIINAIQAMPAGGTLQIITNSEQKEIQISDSGNGIPKRNLENIFDLFYTTKSAGTGLGLPTAYKIVKEHGGDIRVESEEGSGTKVIIRL